jgi:hypothetical protein
MRVEANCIQALIKGREIVEGVSFWCLWSVPGIPDCRLKSVLRFFHSGVYGLCQGYLTVASSPVDL